MRIFVLFLAGTVFAFRVSADQSASFDQVWAEAKAQIYPAEKMKLFSESKRVELRALAQVADTTEGLADIINPFLATLQVSHTYFYDDHHPDYFMLRSLFSTRELAKPKINHAGMQVQKLNGRYVVRAVLDGYPAAKAGLRRGDVLLQINGQEFHPYSSFNPRPKKRSLSFQRNGKPMQAQLNSVFESPHYSFWQATKNSIRKISVHGKSIGYIHLWSGTDEKFLATLKAAVLNDFKNTDALVLDARDGFGGAWWDYLDPFFADSSSYFIPTPVTRAGKGAELQPPRKLNSDFYGKPMALLINEGVRSGKEALTYQLKKSKRAKLIGTPTAGAFAMGRGVFADQKKNFILYLSTGEMLLDGNKIEGNPIQPEILVPFPLDQTLLQDPQLEMALKTLSP